MITVDSRVGSVELAPTLEQLGTPSGTKVRIGTLEFGDYSFDGNGPRGKASIGVERKRLRDMLSCIRSGRFSGHQLPGLARSYDYPYLMVEGIWRANPDSGILEEGVHGGWRAVRLGYKAFMHSELDRYLCTIEICTPIRVRLTRSVHDTCCFMLNLYHWFQKDWDDHKAHKILYNAALPQTMMVKPSLVRRWASDLDGIGWEKSGTIERVFRTGGDLAIASQKDWENIPGIGKTLSRRIVKAIWEGEED